MVVSTCKNVHLGLPRLIHFDCSRRRYCTNPSDLEEQSLTELQTTSSCQSFLLAMVLFPEVQKKAQAELDRVVGSTRLPDYDDLDAMPYIQAVVMETMRWMPVLPIGIPHAVIADDTYKGYHIPKNSIVIPVSAL